MIAENEFAGPIAPVLDLVGALPAHLKRNRPDRGDERFAHFSDIGRCDRQIYARRAAMFDNTPAERLLFTFEVGHFAEAKMLAALREKYEPDWEVWHGGIVIAEHRGNGRFTFHDRDDYVDLSKLDPRMNVVGHPDFYMRRVSDGLGVVIDAKTTSFPFRDGVRSLPGMTRTDYILQAAGYAVAFDAIYGKVTSFGIWSACKSGGGDELVMYATEDYRPMILRRLAEMLDVTDPSAPEPPAQPPNFTVRIISRGPRKGTEVSAACEWCNNTSCPRNENLGDLAD